MKKFLFILLLIIMVIPFNTQALSIVATSISSSKEETTGHTFFATINIGFSGVERKNVNSDGVGAIIYKLEFDDSLLSITNVVSDFFNSEIYKDDSGYYIMSVVDEESIDNKCMDGVLACSDYEAKVFFYVKDTNEEKAIIQLKDISVGYYQVNESADYEIGDIKQTQATSNKVATISIKKSDDEILLEPKSNVIMESIPSMGNKVTSVIKKFHTSLLKENVEEENSLEENLSNSFLKSLTIKDSFIDFKNTEFSYIIRIPQTVNKLNISFETEDSKAKSEVVGADDLKKNDDIVKINVTSQDGHKSVYVIHIKREKLSDAEANQILNRLNIGAIAISGSVFILLILAKIVSLLNRRKLNKLAE